MTSELRDLIYFDFEKASSIFSQIEGGWLRERHQTIEGAKENRKGAQVDLKLIKPEFAKASHEKTSVLESKVIHHDLLTHLEQSLDNGGLLLDVNDAISGEGQDYSSDGLRSSIQKPSFITADGWSVIEDYDRFSFIASNFRDLAEFIQWSAVEGIKNSAEYKSLQETIDSKKEAAKSENSSSAKKQKAQEIKKLERDLEEAVNSATSVDDVPDWLIQGIDLFVQTFMPKRINFRVYPTEQNPDFHILSNLKRDCFVDSDLENVLFAYGTRPNVSLSVFGMITSIPNNREKYFDPVAQLDEGSSDQESLQFEVSLRQALRAFEEFEGFVRFSRYPNLTVYPIAVYQKLS